MNKREFIKNRLIHCKINTLYHFWKWVVSRVCRYTQQQPPIQTLLKRLGNILLPRSIMLTFSKRRLMKSRWNRSNRLTNTSPSVFWIATRITSRPTPRKKSVWSSKTFWWRALRKMPRCTNTPFSCPRWASTRLTDSKKKLNERLKPKKRLISLLKTTGSKFYWYKGEAGLESLCSATSSQRSCSTRGRQSGFPFSSTFQA